MNISSETITPVIECPTSKSYANRALILAALKKEKVTLLNIPRAQDVLDMISILKSIGVIFSEENKNISVLNSFPDCEIKSDSPVTLHLGEGGTTVRFLYPLLALGTNKYFIKTSGRISERPMRELYRLIELQGAKASASFIQGPMNLNGTIEVDCSETTQFASSFMHLSLCSSLVVEPFHFHSSKKYLEMTNYMVTVFKNNTEYSVPVDFSSAGYMIAYGVLRQSIQISNIFEKDYYQADSLILDVLDMLGVNYTLSNSGLNINQISEFTRGFDIDGSKCIDLVPTLMYLASFIPFESTITNIKSLQFKECDRLSEMMKILSFFNVKYNYNEAADKFQIYPSVPRADSKIFTTLDDHRMVMVVSLFFKTLGGGEVFPEHSVNKSFPEFFNIFK